MTSHRCEPSPRPGAGRLDQGRRLSTLALLFAFAAVSGGCERDSAQLAPIVIGGQDSEVAGPRVLVNGIATLDVRPDVADVTITLSAERPRPNAALTELRGQSEGLVAALGKIGISGVDLRSSHTGVSTVYEHRGNREIRGYEATQTFVASTTEFEKIGDVLEIAAGFELGSMHTRYRSTRMAEKKREVRDMALRAAERKAKESAEVLGVRLGPVISIEETGRSSSGWGANANAVLNDFSAEGPTGAPVEPGAVPISLTVEVGYAIVAS